VVSDFLPVVDKFDTVVNDFIPVKNDFVLVVSHFLVNMILSPSTPQDCREK
jgi:hypothetical protein